MDMQMIMINEYIVKELSLKMSHVDDLRLNLKSANHDCSRQHS